MPLDATSQEDKTQTASGGDGQGQGGGAGDGKSQAKPTFENFEAFLDAQPDEVKALIDGHTKGLKSALETERTARKGFEKELRDAAKKLEKGSDERQNLEGLADKLNKEQRRADFFDLAHTAGVTNLRLAWLAAQEEDLIPDDVHRTDFGRIKERYPELFVQAQKENPKTPKANAGEGTGSEQQAAGGMNAFIRASAGRG
jgi:hypothetical protein